MTHGLADGLVAVATMLVMVMMLAVQVIRVVAPFRVIALVALAVVGVVGVVGAVAVTVVVVVAAAVAAAAEVEDPVRNELPLSYVATVELLYHVTNARHESRAGHSVSVRLHIVRIGEFIRWLL